MKLNSSTKGFTLIELLISITIISVLFALGTLSWSSIERDSQIDEIVSEIKTSIAKAQAQSLNNLATGLYFEEDRYILFYGTFYNPVETKNEIVTLPPGIILSDITFPAQALTFNRLSGHPENYTPPMRLSVQVTNSSKKKTININRLGTLEVQ